MILADEPGLSPVTGHYVIMLHGELTPAAHCVKSAEVSP